MRVEYSRVGLVAFITLKGTKITRVECSLISTDGLAKNYPMFTMIHREIQGFKLSGYNFRTKSFLLYVPSSQLPLHITLLELF